MKASSDIEDKLERILHLLADLSSESAKGIPVLVEGRKDVKALNELEVKGDIIAVKTRGTSLANLLNEIEERGKEEVILLTDFDRRGKELMRYLKESLEKMKIKPNVVSWKEFSGLLKRDIKDIEGLPGYIETLRGKIRKGIE